MTSRLSFRQLGRQDRGLPAEALYSVLGGFGSVWLHGFGASTF